MMMIDYRSISRTGQRDCSVREMGSLRKCELNVSYFDRCSARCSALHCTYHQGCQISRIFRELPYFIPIYRLPDRSQNLPYLMRCSLASEINVLKTFCSLLIVHSTILSRISTLTRYTDIANLSVCLSVRYIPVPDENGLTYRHSFFHRMVAQSFQFYRHQTSSRNSDEVTPLRGR